MEGDDLGGCLPHREPVLAVGTTRLPAQALLLEDAARAPPPVVSFGHLLSAIRAPHAVNVER